MKEFHQWPILCIAGKISPILISPIAHVTLREVANFTLGENFRQWHAMAKLTKIFTYTVLEKSGEDIAILILLPVLCILTLHNFAIQPCYTVSLTIPHRARWTGCHNHDASYYCYYCYYWWSSETFKYVYTNDNRVHLYTAFCDALNYVGLATPSFQHTRAHTHTLAHTHTHTHTHIPYLL